MTRTEALDLIRSRIIHRTIEDPDTGCWRWQGATLTTGYGHLRLPSDIDPDNRNAYIHRIALIAAGVELDGLAVHHESCRNRDCWRPSHLHALTHSEHMRGHMLERWAAKRLAKQGIPG
jgi:hypothetical protein